MIRTTSRRFRTRAVHAGQQADPKTGAHVTPIYQTSTFAYGSFARGARLFAGEEDGYIYSRIGNPTTRALEEKLANLEGAEDAIAFSSGMAAISALVFSLLKPGDEVAYLGPLYGGTEGLFHEILPRFGLGVVDASARPLEGVITPATKLIYVETPCNPTLRIHDLNEVAAVAQSHGILSVADNTFATPYLTRPLEHGLDLVIHSATKYLGGHGDALGGVLAGPSELLAEVRAEGLRHLGGCLGPHEAYLLLRGVKTLALRMEAHCDGAEYLAQQLSAQQGVKAVCYPGLPQHPGHAVAKGQMRRFGGMLALELTGGPEACAVFLDSLELFTQAVSLGDVESLATHPASTTHALISHDILREQGIGDALVRLSIGVEDPVDLLADLTQALAKASVLNRLGVARP